MVSVCHSDNLAAGKGNTLFDALRVGALQLAAVFVMGGSGVPLYLPLWQGIVQNNLMGAL